MPRMPWPWRYATGILFPGKKAVSGMIYYLQGILREKLATSILLEVNGVGYRISIPLSTFNRLGETGCSQKVYVYLFMRENSWELYGFAGERERECFSLLNNVSGVGPRVALALLSNLSPEEIVDGVENEDTLVFTSIPGVGEKTAKRLLFELKNRLDTLFSLRGEGPIKSGFPQTPKSRMGNDALQALVSLGYKRQAARKALEELDRKSFDDLETLIREALKRI